MNTPPAPAISEELLPCPFCGGNASMSPPNCRPETPYNPADRLYPMVRCMSCYAERPGKDCDYSGRTAIEAWNRRQSCAPKVEQLQAEVWRLDRELTECRARRYEAESRLTKAEPNNYHDAYRGARDDLLEWKQRALKAEANSDELARALAEHVNGKTFMSEPVIEPSAGVEPSPGLLMSMALRLDHALGLPGYYDQFGTVTHARRLECAIADMRKVFEEVSGQGFYKPEREAEYVAMMSTAGTGKETQR